MKSSRSVILTIILLIAVTLGLALLSPLLFSKKDVPHQTSSSSPLKVVSAKGVVESVDDLVIGSQVTGTIMNMPVGAGDPVKKGQPLVLLDSSKVRAQVEQARAAMNAAASRVKEVESGSRTEDVEMAAARVKRAEAVFRQAEDEQRKQERLYEKDAVTGRELDRSRERMSVAQADLNSAQADMKKLMKGEREESVAQARALLAQKRSELDFYESIFREYTLSSPIDGVVTEHLKEAGETVDVGTPLVKLIDPGNLRIRAEIEETDVGKVTVNHKVEVVVDAFKGKVFHGRVTRIFPTVQRKSQKTFDPLATFDINTQTVHAHLDDFDGLKDGMSVTVRFLHE